MVQESLEDLADNVNRAQNSIYCFMQVDSRAVCS